MENEIEYDDNDRFRKCGFSEDNSCYAYTEEFLLNYINNKHPINMTDIEIKEILSLITMSEQSDFNKIPLKTNITKSILGSKKFKKKRTKKKSKKKSKKKTIKKSKKKTIKKYKKKSKKSSKKQKGGNGQTFLQNIYKLKKELEELTSNGNIHSLGLFMMDLLTASEKMGQYSGLNINILNTIRTHLKNKTTGSVGLKNKFLYNNLLNETVNFNIENIWEDPKNNCGLNIIDINTCRIRKPVVMKYWNNPSILSLDTMKIKFKTDINLAELIVWWNWVILLGENTFCGTLTSVLRGQIESQDYTFWRIILYNLLNVPFQGINSIRNQLKMELDADDYQLFKTNDVMTLLTQPNDIPFPEDMYLYRSERYVNGNHWLMDQLLKMREFVLLNRNIKKEGDESKIYISQSSVISTTYNLDFAKKWVKDEVNSVIYIIKGEIDSNGEISLIKGSPWEIEMYGPTRQSEIILAPCMYQIDTWYEEIVSLGIDGKKIYYIELYVLRDFKELIVNNIIKNYSVNDNITYRQKIKIIELILYYLNENENGNGANIFSSFNKKIQEILNIIIDRINSLKELSHPELFEIMSILGRSDSKNYREFIELLKNITPNEDLTPSMD